MCTNINKNKAEKILETPLILKDDFPHDSRSRRPYEIAACACVKTAAVLLHTYLYFIIIIYDIILL